MAARLENMEFLVHELHWYAIGQYRAWAGEEVAQGQKIGVQLETEPARARNSEHNGSFGMGEESDEGKSEVTDEGNSEKHVDGMGEDDDIGKTDIDRENEHEPLAFFDVKDIFQLRAVSRAHYEELIRLGFQTPELPEEGFDLEEGEEEYKENDTEEGTADSEGEDEFVDLWQAAFPLEDADSALKLIDKGISWKKGNMVGSVGEKECKTIMKASGAGNENKLIITAERALKKLANA